MEKDTWSFGFSSSSRNFQTSLKSQSDFCFELEEIEGDDDVGVDYPCPFCSEDYDLVELCFHIDDEHPLEANHGICPVCATRVRMNMIEHISNHHRNILKSEQRQKFCKGGSFSPFSSRRDGHCQSFLDGSRSMDSSSKGAPDPFMSFIFNLPSAASTEVVQLDSSTEISLEQKTSNKDTSEMEVDSSALSDTEQMEKFKRSVFVQGLFLSTFFHGGF